MSPIAQSEAHDAPRLIGRLVQNIAAMVEDIVVASEDPIGGPVVAHELPEVFGWVELGTCWQQRQDCDFSRHAEFSRQVPTRLVHQEPGVSAGRHFRGD